MAKSLTLTLPIPTHITAKAKIVEAGGMYFGTEWTFTAHDDAGEHIMMKAISDMLADYSPEQIADALAVLRGGDRNAVPDMSRTGLADESEPYKFYASHSTRTTDLSLTSDNRRIHSEHVQGILKKANVEIEAAISNHG